MKKTLLLLVAIALTSAKMMAEGLTATLQQGETMTAFYGVNAFKDAYNAAEDGAVITLSEGQFNDVTSIEKSITVIGNMAFDVEGYEKTFLSYTYVKADNVTLEGIYFTDAVILYPINNFHIKRCYIVNSLSYTGDDYNTNTLVDQCVIGTVSLFAKGQNLCVKNCTIGQFSNCENSSNIAYITNCYVRCFYRKSRSSSSYGYQFPYAIYKNNVLFLNYDSNFSRECYLNSPSEYKNNFFLYNDIFFTGSYKVSVTFGQTCINNANIFSEKVYAITTDYPSNYTIDSYGILGDDGTPVGITGGSGFSPYPSIPRITSKQIDSKTDSEGKLNVKITVSTEETLVKEEKPEEENPEEGTGEETTGE